MQDSNKADLSRLNKQLAPFAVPTLRKSIWQLVNTIIPYFMLWGLMIYFVKNNVPYIYTFGLAAIAGLFLVRIFIFFHDCTHGSFFKSRKANNFVGRLTGFITFTPFEEWRQAHNAHHASSGDLNRRGVGDVWTMTVKEYQNAPFLKRLGYRLYRNPFVMFILGPIFLFLVSNRIPGKNSKPNAKRDVWITNLVLLAFVVGMSYWIGFLNFVSIQAPILFIGGMLGIWLFYVQHQYENTYWAPSSKWNLLDAALNGSSYYKLPKVLQWITGNIGFHHIHHLKPSIPNYNLEPCHNSIELFKQVKPLTIKSSLRCIWMDLWDEEQGKMISFRDLKRETHNSMNQHSNMIHA